MATSSNHKVKTTGTTPKVKKISPRPEDLNTHSIKELDTCANCGKTFHRERAVQLFEHDCLEENTEYICDECLRELDSDSN